MKVTAVSHARDLTITMEALNSNDASKAQPDNNDAAVDTVVSGLGKVTIAENNGKEKTPTEEDATPKAVPPPPPMVASTAGLQFIVVSDTPFVEGVPVEAAAFQAAMAHVDKWESDKAVILADFEGEHMGWGGEPVKFLQNSVEIELAALHSYGPDSHAWQCSLQFHDRMLCAQFLRTAAINRETLRPAKDILKPEPGLLFDMRGNSSGITLVRRVMESAAITKVIWGADGDLTSLRYHRTPIRSCTVVDAQLGFSVPGRRLGMAKCVATLPYSVRRGLPAKDLPHNFYNPQAANKRCFRFPLPPKIARYCMDDLHRIEVILRNKTPPKGSYLDAKQATDAYTASLEFPDAGLQWLTNELRFFGRKYGLPKYIKGVQMERAARHIEAVFAGKLTRSQKSSLARLHRSIVPVLRARGVTIPEDLSFAGD